MTQWFYAKDNQKCGPVDTAELKRLAANGELTPGDLIWKDGLKDWVPASKGKGLFEARLPIQPSMNAAKESEEVLKDASNVSVHWAKSLGRMTIHFLNVLRQYGDSLLSIGPTPIASDSHSHNSSDKSDVHNDRKSVGIVSSSSKPQVIASQNMSSSDPRPYCMKCRTHVSPQVVMTTKNVGPTMLIDTGGPVDFIKRNTQSMTHRYCSVCGHEVCSVEHCPSCRCDVPVRTEYFRYSAFSWEQKPMGFCTRCQNQVSGPEKSCFIATAAFGSHLAPEVQRLRNFRDQSLLPNSFGRLFVCCYYLGSPPIAALVEKSTILRWIARLGIRIAIAVVGKSSR